MAGPFRLGIVGIGDIAALHAQAAQQSGVEVCIAAGSNRARAAELAAQVGAQLYESYDNMLADPTVTAVDLCVPNHVHRAYAERAFAAGKHVLCEKPIALTLEDADAMIAGAKAAGVTLMIGHVLRFWPEYRATYERYRRGELGKLTWLSLRRLTGVLDATQGADGWRADPARSGGATLDLQIHDLDFVCWLLGAPDVVYTRGVRSASGAWDHVVTTLSYEDNSGVSIEASFLMGGAPFEISFHLLSDRGAVGYRYSPENFALHGLHGETAAESKPSLVLYPRGQAAETLIQPQRDSFEAALAGEITEFVASIQEGRAPACTGEDARLVLSVALASLQSAETGEPVISSQ